jgi:hypothetical protein
MRNVMIIAFAAAALSACATRQQAVSTGAGATAGALVAGPIGAVVGAGAGAIVGAPGGVVDSVEGRRR